jgi:hypothetical protein
MRLDKINISPMQALKDLDTLYKVYFTDSKKGFEIGKTVSLSKNQEKILQAVSKKLLDVA